MKIMSLNSSI